MVKLGRFYVKEKDKRKTGKITFEYGGEEMVARPPTLVKAIKELERMANLMPDKKDQFDKKAITALKSIPKYAEHFVCREMLDPQIKPGKAPDKELADIKGLDEDQLSTYIETRGYLYWTDLDPTTREELYWTLLELAIQGVGLRAKSLKDKATQRGESFDPPSG